MNEHIKVHGNPEKSVFGLIGSDTETDEEKFYIKVENDSKNTGWKEIPPTPSPTPTISVTPTKTPIVTRQNPTATPTPTFTRTPTITPTISQTPGSVTPSPTSTPDKTTYYYSIASTGQGQAHRIDGPDNGTFEVLNTTMQLKAEANYGYSFISWNVPEGVVLSDIYSLNPEVTKISIYSDITITANFTSDQPPQYPTYAVYGVANWQGILGYYYIDGNGNWSTFYQTGYLSGQIVSDAGCANQITGVYGGCTAELTDQSC